MVLKKAAKKSTALVPWKEKFASYAQDDKDQVASIGGGTSVKFGRGTITVGGLPIKGPLECIIIGSCALNAWWEADFDKDDIQPPDCYAIALKVGDAEMAPHPECTSPQSELCKNCEKNQFGTAKTGRGKACANRVRLGIITSKDAEDSDNIATAELGIGSVSPANLTRWGAYVKSLQDLEGGVRPTWAVVTEITSSDDPDIQIRLDFRLVETIDDSDVLAELEKRVGKVQEELQKPYAPRTEKAAKPAGRGRNVPATGQSKKFAAAPAKGARR
jgi:hypothetical protein